MTRVYLSIGSNIEREHNLRSSVHQIGKLYAPLSLSSVYQSRAVGFDGPDFYNMVVAFDTDESLSEVYACLRGIEDAHGRLRGAEKYSSRPLDIDLLLFGDLMHGGSPFDIPRAEISRCAFVLLPLCEIAAETVHPETGRTIGDMWREFDAREQPIHKIDFEF